MMRSALSRSCNPAPSSGTIESRAERTSHPTSRRDKLDDRIVTPPSYPADDERTRRAADSARRRLAVRIGVVALAPMTLLAVYVGSGDGLTRIDTLEIVLCAALGIALALGIAEWAARAASDTPARAPEGVTLGEPECTPAPESTIESAGAARATEGSPVPMARLQVLEQHIAMLGHDVRNPLNAIAAAVELLNRTAADAPLAVRAREIIANQTQRLASRMDRLTSLAAPTADEDVSPTVDLSVLALSAIADAKPHAAASRRTMHATLSRAPVLGDATDLRAMLDSALEHALAATPEGGSVLLNMQPREDEARLALRCLDARGLAVTMAPWARPDFEIGDGSGTAIEFDSQSQTLVMSIASARHRHPDGPVAVLASGEDAAARAEPARRAAASR